MTESKTDYNFRRRPGPAKDEPAQRTLQITMPIDDSKLVRSLVGAGQLSGFGWRSCLIMAGILYSEDAARERAEQMWVEILYLSTPEQLEQIHKGLMSLVVMTKRAITNPVGKNKEGTSDN